ncbi:hypothetical protein BD309DRAFT_950348 [Dichomitus squalens]|uniref:Uncharacterized protein n=1 Tax=Dichomitus squalens TaxID=114155 RepID=A0A4Q9P3G2_9APHY|nr:hypothetical protein BD309DRAFT_950348 [Dichomitus squalens]TBU64412.1 hypothetical protein BD310DRAFT_914601 [Dichomitus squalens]
MFQSGLPTYSEIQAHYRARAELKQNFATLINDQRDIQELFKTVAAELDATPEVGEKHALSDEWNRLRRRHSKIYRESQQNAALCAQFLKNFAEILVPLSQSEDLTIDQKKLMIGKFLETIPVHLNAAHANAESFSELAKDVEVFPRKVASALRIKAEPPGLLASIWTGIEEVCYNVWQTLNRLLTKLVYTFKVALARLEKLRFSCFGISVDMHFNRYESLEPAPLSQNESEEERRERIASEVQDNCDALQHKLTAFESAWYIVRLACSRLSSDLALAKTFTTCYPPVPQAVDTNLRAAALVHTPLVDCLNAYSTGQLPDFRDGL